jgi:metal-responsive CopG/Arc/MetJ family transcriptional regulator
MADPKKDQRIPVMMSRDDVGAIDDWRRRQADVPSRSEAIRRLVEQALASRPAKRLNPNARVAAASYAEQAAGEAIDKTQKHSGQSKAVKAERKKRLTRLPPELAKRSRSGG